MSAKISRRKFLQLSLLGTGSAVLAACAAQPTAPAPAPTQAAAPEATKPPEPTTAPAAAEPITLRLLYYGGAGSAHYDEFAKRYTEESGGKIKEVTLEVAPGDQMVQKQETELATGTLADLVRSDTSYWPYLAKRGAWLVLEDLVKGANLDLSEWINIEWFRKWTDGKLSGLGGESGINQIVAFYNKPWVQEVWGKEPTNDWTMDDYVDLMTKAVASKGGPGKGYFGGNAPIGGYHVHDGWIRNWGGQFISDDGKTELFAEDKCQVGIKWNMDQIKSGNYPTRKDLATDSETKMFLAGKMITTIGGPGYVYGIVSGAKDANLDIGWVLAPKGPSAFENPPRRAFTLFSNPLSVYAKTKYPAETFGLLLRITSVEAQKWITMKIGRQPGARLSTWYDPDVAKAYPMFPLIADLMKSCTDVFPCPANTRFPEWATIGTNEIPPLVYGDIPYTKENIQTINDDLQAVLDEPLPTSLVPTPKPTAKS